MCFSEDPTYQNHEEWDNKAEELAQMFIENFKKFKGTPEGENLEKFGTELQKTT